MSTMGMQAEISYRQEKLRRDYQRCARHHHGDRTWTDRRSHTDAVREPADLV